MANVITANENDNYNIQSVWIRVLRSLRFLTSPDVPLSYFDFYKTKIVPVSLTNGAFILAVQSETDLTHKARLLFPYIAQALKSELSIPYESIQIQLILRPDLFDTEDPIFDFQAENNKKIFFEDETSLRSRYNALVRPDRIISIPRGFFRWAHLLGPTLCSIVTASRQIAFLSSTDKSAKTSEIESTWENLSRWAGMSEKTFRRHINDPVTQVFLRVVERPSGCSHRYDPVGKTPKQLPNLFAINMEIPMTPADESSLIQFLEAHDARNFPHEAILKSISTDPGEILSENFSFPSPDWSQWSDTSHTVADVVKRYVQSRLSDEDEHLLIVLSERLYPQKSCVQVPWYRFLNWFPLLGQTMGWFTIYCDSKTFYNPNTKETRNTFSISGFNYLSTFFGIEERWFRERLLDNDNELSILINKFAFITEMKRSRSKITQLSFQVSEIEPLTPDDEILFNQQPRCNQDAIFDQLGNIQNAVSDQLGNNQDVVFDQLRSPQNAVIDQLAGVQNAVSDQQLKDLKINDLIKNKYLITTTDDSILLDQEEKSVVVENQLTWNISSIIKRTVNDSGVTKKLLADGKLTKECVISWLLYVASAKGEKLGAGYLVKKYSIRPLDLPEDKSFVKLANLNFEDLKILVSRAKDNMSISHYFIDAPYGADEWNTCMQGIKNEKAVELYSRLFGS